MAHGLIEHPADGQALAQVLRSVPPPVDALGGYVRCKVIAYCRALHRARMSYERLIRQADQIPFEGWDFGVFRGRFAEAEPSWEFSKLLRTHMRRSSSMLDLGTGEGSSCLLWRRCRLKRSRQRHTSPTSLSPGVALRRSRSESSTPRITATCPSHSPKGASISWSAATSRTRLPRSGASSSPAGPSSPSRSAAGIWRSSTAPSARRRTPTVDGEPCRRH
jgi:hypothetical protein